MQTTMDDDDEDACLVTMPPAPKRHFHGGVVRAADRNKPFQLTAATCVFGTIEFMSLMISYLSNPRDVAKVVFQINKRMSTLLARGVVELNARFYNLAENHLASFISKFPNLRTMRVEGGEDASSVAKRFEWPRTLSVLRLGSPTWTFFNWNTATTCHVKVLQINITGSDVSAFNVFMTRETFPTLETLLLGVHCRSVPCTLARSAKLCIEPILPGISSFHCDLSAACGLHNVVEVGQCSQMQDLALFRCAKVAAFPPNLRRLVLRDTDADWASDNLRLPHLKDLSLSVLQPNRDFIPFINNHAHNGLMSVIFPSLERLTIESPSMRALKDNSCLNLPSRFPCLKSINESFAASYPACWPFIKDIAIHRNQFTPNYTVQTLNMPHKSQLPAFFSIAISNAADLKSLTNNSFASLRKVSMTNTKSHSLVNLLEKLIASGGYRFIESMKLDAFDLTGWTLQTPNGKFKLAIAAAPSMSQFLSLPHLRITLCPNSRRQNMSGALSSLSEMLYMLPPTLKELSVMFSLPDHILKFVNDESYDAKTASVDLCRLLTALRAIEHLSLCLPCRGLIDEVDNLPSAPHLQHLSVAIWCPAHVPFDAHDHLERIMSRVPSFMASPFYGSCFFEVHIFQPVVVRRHSVSGHEMSVIRPVLPKLTPAHAPWKLALRTLHSGNTIQGICDEDAATWHVLYYPRHAERI